jgi:glycosyltransferase involved in cell wall biosynthesis
MSRKLVSVITPTFNRAYCLGRAIDSALGQTHQPVEVVVADDGSTDGTGDMIARVYGKDPRVRYVFQENRGVSAARNLGLATVRGDFVAFLDSDDVWKPWKLEVQLACLAGRPAAGMIWSDMEAVDPEGRITHDRFLRMMYSAYRWFPPDRLFAESAPLARVAQQPAEFVAGGTLYVGDIFSPMVMGNLVHTSTVVLRRDRLEKVRAFNEDLRVSGEDHDFHLRTCREGPVAFVDLATIRYQRGMPDQLTRHRLFAAVNFLTTVSEAVERDGERITLPPWMLNEVFAEANAWVGEVHALQGDYPEARRHLARSLVYKKWQPRAVAMLALCCLPAKAGRALRWSYRAANHPLRKVTVR